MENIVVLNEEQFEDILYRTVSRCLDEKNIGNHVEKPEDEGFYDRDEIFFGCISMPKRPEKETSTRYLNGTWRPVTVTWLAIAHAG